jgi:mersacidin/lichenicidin family type 2 lantibiotic
MPLRLGEEVHAMKKNIDLARAWRDEDYFLSLTDEERASLGIHPAGIIGVDDEILRSITGGCMYTYKLSFCTPCPGRHCAA